jgi:uncharacterized membrane protein YgdD (TMEM256/DUF423 family)
MLSRASALWLFLGALNGLIAVAAGAYGRHAALDDYHKEMFAIGAEYQMVHALALIAVAWLASSRDRRRSWTIAIAGGAFAFGNLLFSGTLYWFGQTGVLPVAGAAPLGGMLLMAGWLALMIAAIGAGLRNPG